jgi:manganese transport protein
VWLTARRSVMGPHVNRRLTTLLAATAGAIIIGLNVVLLGGLAAGG